MFSPKNLFDVSKRFFLLGPIASGRRGSGEEIS